MEDVDEDERRSEKEEGERRRNRGEKKGSGCGGPSGEEQRMSSQEGGRPVLASSG